MRTSQDYIPFQITNCFIRLKFSNIVEIIVGPTEECFYVHPHILTQQSTFFKAACSERWRSSIADPIELPEDDPHIFDIYLNCLYSGNVDLGDLEHALAGERELTDEARTDLRLIKSHVLADKLGDVLTANKIIDRLIECSDASGNIPIGTSIVSSNTAPGSPLRRLFIDYYVHEADMECLEILVNSGDVATDFVGEILLQKHRLTCRTKIRNSTKISEVYVYNFTSSHKCRYHQHDSAHPYCGDECEGLLEK